MFYSCVLHSINGIVSRGQEVGSPTMNAKQKVIDTLFFQSMVAMYRFYGSRMVELPLLVRELFGIYPLGWFDN